jgi:hypothetical protein
MAAMPRPAAARTTLPAFAGRAFLSGSTAPRKSEVIKETEIPVSVYTPDAKGVGSATSDHSSIPVHRMPPGPQPPVEEAPMKVIKPLTNEVYAQMPATMQKMSVKDKVIIITG